MEKTETMPRWVFWAFSSISTRKGALLLIASSLLFAIYCIPWSLHFTQNKWVAELFLIDDWSWFAVMAPSTLWYVASLRWMDANLAWGSQ